MAAVSAATRGVVHCGTRRQEIGVAGPWHSPGMTATTETTTRTGPGQIGFRITPAAMQGVDWQILTETWALAGERDVFDAGWISDHLTDASRERGGPAFESLTTLAALAHLVPGKWLGVAVISNTFRHPSVLAKSATVLDNVTGGRFMLGLGAGWHVGEHDAFGIPLPEPRELFDRLESSVKVLRALFSDEARSDPGVTLDDPFFPLRGATNLPSPIRPGGPIAVAGRWQAAWDPVVGALRRWMGDARQSTRRRRLFPRVSRADLPGTRVGGQGPRCVRVRGTDRLRLDGRVAAHSARLRTRDASSRRNARDPWRSRGRGARLSRRDGDRGRRAAARVDRALVRHSDATRVLALRTRRRPRRSSAGP